MNDTRSAGTVVVEGLDAVNLRSVELEGVSVNGVISIKADAVDLTLHAAGKVKFHNRVCSNIIGYAHSLPGVTHGVNV